MSAIRNSARAFAVAFALAATSAHAEFSDEWKEAAAEMEAGCDAAESALPRGGASPAPAKPLKLPERLRGPLRPHMCVIVRVSLDEDGAAREVEEVYRGPENLNYVFVRSTVGSVKKWRFNLAGAPAAQYGAMYARLDFVPQGNWRYAIYYSYWSGGAPAVE